MTLERKKMNYIVLDLADYYKDDLSKVETDGGYVDDHIEEVTDILNTHTRVAIIKDTHKIILVNTDEFKEEIAKFHKDNPIDSEYIVTRTEVDMEDSKYHTVLDEIVDISDVDSTWYVNAIDFLYSELIHRKPNILTKGDS